MLRTRVWRPFLDQICLKPAFGALQIGPHHLLRQVHVAGTRQPSQRGPSHASSLAVGWPKTAHPEGVSRTRSSNRCGSGLNLKGLWPRAPARTPSRTSGLGFGNLGPGPPSKKRPSHASSLAVGWPKMAHRGGAPGWALKRPKSVFLQCFAIAGLLNAFLVPTRDPPLCPFQLCPLRMMMVIIIITMIIITIINRTHEEGVIPKPPL